MKATIATPEDIVQLVALGYMGYKENDMQVYNQTPNYEKAMYAMTMAVVDDVPFVIRNKDNSKLIDGCLVLIHSETWFSTKIFLNNALFYIKPEARSLKAANTLLKAAKEYAIMNELEVVIDIIGGGRLESKKALLERNGFKPFGSLYVFQPNT